MAFVLPSGAAAVCGTATRFTRTSSLCSSDKGVIPAVGFPIRVRLPHSKNGVKRSKSVPIKCSDMGITFSATKFDSNLRIGVITTRWNAPLVGYLKDDVYKTLCENLPKSNIVAMEVPGAFELPLAARLMCTAQKVDAVICIGVLVRGESEHYEHISSTVSYGLMEVQLSTGVPTVFGVLCCQTQSLAEERSKGGLSQAQNWARTALEMSTLKKSQTSAPIDRKKSVGFF